MLIMSCNFCLRFGRQPSVQIAVVVAVEIIPVIPLDSEQRLDINFDNKCEKHQRLWEQKGLSVASQFETPQRTFMIVPAVPEHPICDRHGATLTYARLDQRSDLASNPRWFGSHECSVISLHHTMPRDDEIA